MENSRRGGGVGVITGSGLESTSSLLTRLRAGDDSAREALVARYLPALTRWAHGRLSSRCRDLLDTDDLVQITLLRAFSRMQDLEYRGQGGLLAYLRQILLNRIQDEVRRVGRTPPMRGIDPRMPDPALISDVTQKRSASGDMPHDVANPGLAPLAVHPNRSAPRGKLFQPSPLPSLHHRGY